MKKFIKYLIIICALFSLAGCDKIEDLYDDIFGKKTLEEKIEAMYEDIKVSADSVLTSLDPAKGFEELANKYSGKEEIESVSYDENSITVRFANSTGHFWKYTPDEGNSTYSSKFQEDEGMQNTVIIELRNSNPVSVYSGTRKVLLINTQSNEAISSNRDAINDLKKLFTDIKWDVIVKNAPDADVNFFKTGLSGYDVVYLIARGHKEKITAKNEIIDDVYFWIQTGQDPNSDGNKKESDGVIRGTTGAKKVFNTYYYVSQKFIEDNYNNSFSNSFIYTTAGCMGFVKTEDMVESVFNVNLMAKAFKAEAFVGFQEDDTNGAKIGVDLFTNMSKRINVVVKQAIEEAGGKDKGPIFRGSDDGHKFTIKNSEIVVYPNDGSNYILDIPLIAPSVVTLPPTDKTETSSILWGEIKSYGNSDVTDRGFYWRKSEDPISSLKKQSITSSTDKFSFSLKDLEPSKSYIVKAYAENKAEISYGQEVSFETTKLNINDIAVNKVDFGKVTINTPSPVKKLRISNNCKTKITITSLTLSGDKEQFSLSGWNGKLEIDAYDYKEFDVAFNPKKTGTFSLSIQLVISGVGTYTQPILLGEGIQMQDEIKAPSVSTSTTISNLSSTTVTVSGNVNSTGGSDIIERGFVYCKTTESQDPAIGGKTLKISGKTGAFNGTLTGLEPGKYYVYKAYAKNSKYTGYGAIQQFMTPVAPPTPTRIISTSSLLGSSNDFGDISVRTTATTTMYVHNDGNETLNISSISSENPAFTVDQSYTKNVSPNGGSQPVKISFTPTAAIEYSTRIKISSNATNSNGYVSVFTGTGTAVATPVISLSGTLGFGSVTVGASKTATLTIKNTGNATLNVTGINCPSGFSSDWPSGGSLIAGSSKNVTITFKPTSAANYGGNITVSSSNASNSPQTIAASGTGTAVATPVISLSGTLGFGSATVGASKTATLTIKNTGNATLNVTGINCPNGFSSDWPSGGSLIAGSSKNVTITFKPTSANNYSGKINIMSNASNGTQSIDVSGMGTQAPAPKLEVSKTSLPFEANGGFLRFNLSSENVNWTVSKSVSWLSVYPSSGTGGAVVEVTADANTSTSSRSSTVTVSGGGITRTISVTQAGKSQSAPTFTPAMGTYTACSGSNKTCGGHTFLAGTIKATVVGYSASSNTINFRIKKCSGSFTNSGTVYVNKGVTCDNAVSSASYGAGVSEINITAPLQSGTNTYFITVASATTDYFYANTITVTY